MKPTTILDRKPSAIAATVAAALALVVAVAVVVTVGIVLTGTKCTLAAIRRRARRKLLLSNLYMLPNDQGDLTFRPAAAKADIAGQESLVLGKLYQMDRGRDVLVAG
jgi:hypothetical protein